MRKVSALLLLLVVVSPASASTFAPVVCEEVGAESHPGELEFFEVTWTQTGQLLGFGIRTHYQFTDILAIVGAERNALESHDWRGFSQTDLNEQTIFGFAREAGGSGIPYGPDQYTYSVNCFQLGQLCDRVNFDGETVTFEAFFVPKQALYPGAPKLDSVALRCWREEE
ncbi:MAG: hypothetical protein KDD44_11610 [Bdellovibrionales bacterium]|nr:hypothetical protein [Bdellovibrionales bacterium]